jgi:hypothetical protein
MLFFSLCLFHKEQNTSLVIFMLCVCSFQFVNKLTDFHQIGMKIMPLEVSPGTYL